MPKLLFHSIFLLLVSALPSVRAGGDTVGNLPITDTCPIPPGAKFQQYFYDNGQVSAQGYMLQGQPEGYWENFDMEGNKVSEGCRVGFQLQGVWKFYRQRKPVSEITYRDNLKNGPSRYFFPDRIVYDNYINDTLNGIRRIFDTSGNLTQTTVFVNGTENGFDCRYNSYGDIYLYTYYRSGMVMFRENVNRRDKDGKRQGPWKEYYSIPQVKWECNYKDDLRHGYYKEYDSLGNLLLLQKYVDGVLQSDADELAELEVYTEYYSNGQIRYRVGLKNGQPEGICREYDSITGDVKRALVFEHGKIIGSRQVDAQGNLREDGNEFYPNGKLKSKGRYYKGKKWGTWTYFYPDGNLQQEGEYRNGKADGTWVWYYPDGQVRLEQEYYEGKPDGKSTEYSPDGKIIAQGQYMEGLEEGKWVYVQQDMKTQGSYAGGERDGMWRTYYIHKGKARRIAFQGAYSGGLENGLHQYFTFDGKLVEEGYYRMGKKVGTWTKYDINGLPAVTVTYDTNEEESKYNGKKVLNKDELQGETK